MYRVCWGRFSAGRKDVVIDGQLLRTRIVIRRQAGRQATLFFFFFFVGGEAVANSDPALKVGGVVRC
jgi:hypothetical protein